MRRMVRRWTISVAALMLAACGSYPKPEIAETAASLGRVQTVFRDYYTTLNTYGRDVYVRSQVFRGQPISPEALDQKGSVYPDAAIQARLSALKLVGRYVELLNTYGGGTQAKDLGAASGAVSQAAFKLSADLNAALGAGDAGLAKYQGPVSNLIGLVAQWGTDAYLRKSFKEQVHNTTPRILEIMALLKADGDNVLAPKHLVGTSLEFSSIAGYYNARAATLSFQERSQVAPMLIEAATARDAANHLSFSPVIDAADKAVVVLDKRTRGEATPEEAAVALEEFTDRVDALRELVEQLKQAQKE